MTDKKKEDLPQLYSRKEASKILCVSESTLCRMIQANMIDYIIVFRTVKFTRENLMDYLAKNQVKSNIHNEKLQRISSKTIRLSNGNKTVDYDIG